MNDTTKRYPRSTAEAFADERYPAIEHHRAPTSYQWPVAIVLGIILAVIGYHLYTVGTTALDEAMAAKAARVEAIEQAQAEKRKQDAAQAMCGGPESTPVPLGGGMYDCVNKRGFKQVAK